MTTRRTSDTRSRRRTSGKWTPGVLVVAVLAAPPLPAGAQARAQLDSFLRGVEAASARYVDVDSAVASGYRRLGPDFPGMGEHWIHPGRVIGGALDPERPPVLAYTTVDGRRRLVGFAFTRILGPDEAPPAGPFPVEAWHDHTGGVDEESLLLSGPASAHAAGESFRLSMVHLWIPFENPEGRLAQNNWALPFLRVGIDTPSDMSNEASRALALATESGAGFYEELLRHGVGLRDPDLHAASEAFAAAGLESERWLASVGPGASPTKEQVELLRGIWVALWRRLERTVSPDAFEAMAVLGRS